MGNGLDFVPAHLVEQAPGATPDRTAFFLHGILGSARNWRTFARQLVRRHPRWRVVLVDLRNHGDSVGAPPPHTLSSAAADLVTLGEQLGAHPEIVVGHSFGGKVGLVYARDHGERLSQLWVLDAVPGAGGRPDGEVVAVLGALRDLAVPVARREDVAKALIGRGFSGELAAWMTTNLKPADGGYDWRFDLDAIEAMIADYWEQDLFPFLEGEEGPEVHLVRAGRSDRWTPDVLERLDHLSPRAHVHVLAESGHWVHVDDPQGLMALLDQGFGG